MTRRENATTHVAPLARATTRAAFFLGFQFVAVFMKVVPFPLIEQPAIGLLCTATTSQNPDQNNVRNDKSFDDPRDTAVHERGHAQRNPSKSSFANDIRRVCSRPRGARLTGPVKKAEFR
jgi:hypothetical protein